MRTRYLHARNFDLEVRHGERVGERAQEILSLGMHELGRVNRQLLEDEQG